MAGEETDEGAKPQGTEEKERQACQNRREGEGGEGGGDDLTGSGLPDVISQ